MSKNLQQVYVANPITTNQSTDLMYFARSPYAAADDTGMTYASFAAQFGAPYTAAALTKTDDTNVTITLGGTPNTALLQATSLTMGWSGQLSLTRGGSNASLTASNGGIIYSTATAMAVLAGTATAGKVLQSGATAAPTWSTPTYPSASGTAGQVLASDGTNIIYSTATFPVVGGAAGNILISNGTNYIASTSLWPNTVGSAGTMIRSNGTSNAYSTSTFADTYAVSTLLYASSANAVTGLATSNRAALTTNATGVPTWIALTDGQFVVGSTAGAPAAATLTAGAGISITNASNSITVASTGVGSMVWNDVAGTTQAAAVNQGYIISNASLTTVTLPATAAEGSTFAIAGKGAAGWVLQANTGQVINYGSSPTSSAGSLASTNQWDSVTIVCVTANTTFSVIASQGILTVA